MPLVRVPKEKIKPKSCECQCECCKGSSSSAPPSASWPLKLSVPVVAVAGLGAALLFGGPSGSPVESDSLPETVAAVADAVDADAVYPVEIKELIIPTSLGGDHTGVDSADSTERTVDRPSGRPDVGHDEEPAAPRDDEPAEPRDEEPAAARDDEPAPSDPPVRPAQFETLQPSDEPRDSGPSSSHG